MEACSGDFCEDVPEITMDESNCLLKIDSNVEESVTRSVTIIVEGNPYQQGAPTLISSHLLQ